MPGPDPGRWIPPNRLGGSWQMAIDAWLLDQLAAAADSPAPATGVLRVYRWSRPTLSLGHHQRQLEPAWLRLARAGHLDLVRRPSGGTAVLHGHDLTYALIWPQPPRHRRQAYAATCAWLQACFAELGQPLLPGGDPSLAPPPSCFARATSADLVHADGSKRIGSAQLWRHGALLQHGSIQLQPPVELWRQVFGQDPPALAPLPLAAEAFIALLRRQAEQWLPGVTGCGLRALDLRAAEWAAIAERLGRYRLPELSGAETSPAVTMERAT